VMPAHDGIAIELPS